MAVTYIQSSLSESRASAVDYLSILSEINFVNFPVRLLFFLGYLIFKQETQRLLLSCSTCTAVDAMPSIKVATYKLLGLLIVNEAQRDVLLYYQNFKDRILFSLLNLQDLFPLIRRI
jgi:hypothetical protein